MRRRTRRLTFYEAVRGHQDRALADKAATLPAADFSGQAHSCLVAERIDNERECW